MANDLLGGFGSRITTAFGNSMAERDSGNDFVSRLGASREARFNGRMNGIGTLLNGLGNILGNVGTNAGNNQTSPPANDDGMTPQEKAFEQFRNSTGYQFRLGQGYDAVNANYAARGMLESGAAEKSLLEYGQNYASNEFANYLAALGNQQALGATAASSAAGIGANYGNSLANLNTNFANAASGINQNFANNVTGINNNLANAQGSYAQNVGNAYSNQAIAQANNTNAMIGGIGNAVGNVAGYFAYRPYG